MLPEGDVLYSVHIKDEFLRKEQENYEFLKAPDKLDIVYKEDELLTPD